MRGRRSGVQTPNSGANKLDSGFHPSGEGRMRSMQLVCSECPLQKIAELKYAAFSWSLVVYMQPLRRTLPHGSPTVVNRCGQALVLLSV